MNIKMLMFLWQDLGNIYNTSVGTGYGNINSELSIKLGQDRQFKKMGITEALNLQQKPLAPSSEYAAINGNGNRCKLWDQSHLLELIKALALNKFTDGLRFVLSCQATHDIYASMSVASKLHLLAQFLSK